jgi:GDP-L-fucose synthase
MKRVLVTGGTGFLGKHVVPKLQKHFGMENVIAPSSKELNLLQNDIGYDIQSMNVDVIVHMAAKCGGILANKNSPADFLRDNAQMGLNIYDVARILNISVYSLGSVCMYPKFCPAPFKEDDIWNGYPEETNAPYGMAKRTLMMLHQTYRQQYGLKGAFLIPVNMYGTEDHFDLTNSHVVPALINKFVNAKKNNISHVTCWGSGEATRELMAVQDCAEAITNCVINDFDSSLPINLGTGTDISIKNLAETIKRLTDYKGEIVFTGEVSDGQPKRRLDVSRAKKLLNWEAKTSLENGLKETIEWYKDNISDVCE